MAETTRTRGVILLDPKSTPSFALGELQPLQHVEEGDRRGGVLRWRSSWEACYDGFYRPWHCVLIMYLTWILLAEVLESEAVAAELHNIPA